MMEQIMDDVAKFVTLYDLCPPINEIIFIVLSMRSI